MWRLPCSQPHHSSRSVSCHLFTTFPQGATVFSNSCAHTTKSQSLQKTCPKLPSQLHSAYSRSCECAQELRTIYIDDVLVASSTPEGHPKHLQTVFEHLTSHGIVINPSKCLFGVSELDFLGHHIERHGITPLPEKVQAIHDFPQPQSQCQLHQFIRLVNFYHRFLPHGADLMQPLHALLKTKSQTLTWNDNSFKVTKEALANASLLLYPQAMPPHAFCRMPLTQPWEQDYNSTSVVPGIPSCSSPGG